MKDGQVRRARYAHGVIAFLGVVVVSLNTANCNNAQCEELRDELFEQLLEWQRCETSADCLIVPGNSGDCSGVMACDFAVNRRHRVAASRKVASLPEETVDCHQCTSPNCPTGEHVACEENTKLCVIVEAFFDGGFPNVIITTPDDEPPSGPPTTNPPVRDAAPDGDPFEGADVIQL